MFNQYIKPMLLKEVEKPFQDDHYLYELKFDGIRGIMYVSKNKLKIISRNGLDITYLYPELTSIKELVGNKKVIFDGEIVAFKNGKPSFSELEHRAHLKSLTKIKEIQETIPVCFLVFDILYEAKDLTNKPLIKRKEILNQYPDTDVFIKSKVYDNGIQLFEKVKQLDLEGIIAKEKNSLYYPGKRVDVWLKIKNFKVNQFLICGYIKTQNKYTLLLGEYKNKTFSYVGKVSVMPDHKTLKKVLKQPPIIKNMDCKEKGVYVKPKYKIKVYYMERTDSNTLRQPFIKKENHTI